MRTLVLASIRRHVRRYVATAVAVVIAVGFMVAVNAISAAARSGVQELAEQQLAGTDLVVEWPTDGDALAAALGADPDVVRPEVARSGYLPIDAPKGPRFVAIDSVSPDEGRRWQQLTDGRFAAAAGEVVLDTARADSLGLALGDAFGLGEGPESRELTVVGLVAASGGPRSAAVYLDPVTAAGYGDQMAPSFVLASVRPGVDPAVVADRVTASLAVVDESSPLLGTEVRTRTAMADEWRLSATDGVDVLQGLLLGFGIVALFVGALVIANTFAIVLAQRERDVALLRCVGATRRQVVRSVTGEAFAVGLLSAVVGVLVGWAAAFGIVAGLGRWVPTAPMGRPALSWLGVVLPVVAAVAVTMIASWAPARRVARIAPVAALQPHQPAVAGSRAGMLRTGIGVLLAGLGGAALVASTTGNVMIGLLGGLVSFVGVLLLLPLIVPVALRAAGALVSRWGVAPRLAVANTGRNPRRTATTTSALLVGVTLVATVLVGIATARQAVATELDETRPVDLTVAPPSGQLTPTVVDGLRDVDGAAVVSVLDGTDATIGGVPVPIVGVDDAARRADRRGEVPGAGEIWLPYSEELGEQADDGERIQVVVGDRSRELTVRYVFGYGPVALVAAPTLGALAPDASARTVWLRAEDGADPASVIDEVVSVTGTQAEVDGGLPERAEALKQVDILLVIVLSLLGVAVVIAVVGVGNTLGLSVLERSRENSLLRALGLPARGLRLTLGIESVMMATTSAVLGGVLGLVYGWFGVRALGADVFVTEPQVVVPIGQLGLLLGAAVVAGLLASVVPARRAAKVKPAEGLASV